jgi:hypothetical protein
MEIVAIVEDLGGNEEMAADIGAVGDRGLHSGGSGTGFTVRGIGRRRSCLRFVAAAALGLIVTAAAVACLSISPGVPEIAKSSSNPWTIFAIDSSGEGQTSIALDSVGKVHVIYTSGEDLKYATNAEGSWVTSTVGEACLWYSSLALDSNDKAHICYHQYADHSSLVYTTNAGGSWANYTVDSTFTTFVGFYPSLALDSNGKVHISYKHMNPHARGDVLKYATNAGGSWAIYSFDPDEFFTAFWTSLAIDSNDRIHISYVGGLGLMYATNAGDSWAIYSLKYGVAVDDGSTSIALDSNDNVHICFNYGLSVGYFTNASGSWVGESIDGAYDPGSDGFNSVSLALDSKDKVRVSYCDTWNQTVNYATNADGSWAISIIDAGGQGCSLELDSADQVHISYYGTEGIMYATNAEQVIPEFGPAGVVVVVMATVCIFVALRRTSSTSTKD